MDQTEQQYIDDLFDRLHRAERGSGQRDASAERYIQQLVSRQPASPYYMAQAIIVQEEALKAAQQRIEALEREMEDQPAQAGGGSFLGGLFGGGAPSRPGSGSAPRSGSVPRAGGMAYPRAGQSDVGPDSTLARYNQTGRGGGFLAGAMATAAGVAGGMVLGSMLTNMLGGDEAKAEEAKPEAENANANEAGNTQQDDQFANVENATYDDNDSFMGGDFGGGDYDI
jgi:hypothetical protein